jgi:hypothetical protein
VHGTQFQIAHTKTQGLVDLPVHTDTPEKELTSLQIVRKQLDRLRLEARSQGAG